MNKRFVPTFLVCTLLLTSWCIPSWYLIGSHVTWFSFSTCMVPSAVAVLGWPVFLLFMVAKYLSTKAGLLLFLCKRLPLVCAGMAMRSKRSGFSLGLPVLAMILFMSHVVGAQVWWYPLHWLFPMALYFVQDTLFVRCLTASYLAHAVGSVVWLYTGTISSAQWQTIFYLVPFERLFFAVGMYMFVQVLCWAKDLARTQKGSVS